MKTDMIITCDYVESTKPESFGHGKYMTVELSNARIDLIAENYEEELVELISVNAMVKYLKREGYDVSSIEAELD